MRDSNVNFIMTFSLPVQCTSNNLTEAASVQWCISNDFNNIHILNLTPWGKKDQKHISKKQVNIRLKLASLSQDPNPSSRVLPIIAPRALNRLKEDGERKLLEERLHSTYWVMSEYPEIWRPIKFHKLEQSTRVNETIHTQVDDEELFEESDEKGVRKDKHGIAETLIELYETEEVIIQAALERLINKLPSHGILNHKARLVVKGYAQIFGVDYFDTFSLVARPDTIRLLFALTAQLGWKVYQMDVKSTFLNGFLQEEIYVEQPEGFVDKGKEEKVYRLRKELYGLKQAPRWYGRIDGHLLSLGFEKSLLESTLYV
ncbi:hypothetical protein MTR67_018622 [Solanum verrucosum]|uniref:Reverse transcriptase Ty1/copia-type domain-containing protein n=1 Tax=Solanum verrucosum TaxID=315347 RepID=A0AAF0TLQ8_SOLVR|nr:hypothetical protein MTR67_018622 [Solanum verrucosum]